MSQDEFTEEQLLDRLGVIADALDQQDALLSERLDLWERARAMRVPEEKVAAASRKSRATIRALLSRHGRRVRV